MVGGIQSFMERWKHLDGANERADSQIFFFFLSLTFFGEVLKIHLQNIIVRLEHGISQGFLSFPFFNKKYFRDP